MFRVLGQTTSGVVVVAGVFSFYETNGLPLDIIFEALRERGAMPCWQSFYLEATRAGMKHKRIIAMLDEAITDVYGSALAAHVCNTISNHVRRTDEDE